MEVLEKIGGGVGGGDNTCLEIAVVHSYISKTTTPNIIDLNYLNILKDYRQIDIYLDILIK